MPEPRRRRDLDSHLPALALETHASRPATATNRRRRGRTGPVPTEIRNGLPDLKPYVYRGVGYDIYTGLGDDNA